MTSDPAASGPYKEINLFKGCFFLKKKDQDIFKFHTHIGHTHLKVMTRLEKNAFIIHAINVLLVLREEIAKTVQEPVCSFEFYLKTTRLQNQTWILRSTCCAKRSLNASRSAVGSSEDKTIPTKEPGLLAKVSGNI